MRLAAQSGSSSSQVLAEYLWGQGTLELNPLSALAQGMYAKAMAGITNGFMTAHTGDEFRGLVALLHELAHCNQDMCTGVGFWDWMQRLEALPPIMGEARDLSWVPQRASSLGALSDRYCTGSLVNAAGFGRDWEGDVLLKHLGGLVTAGAEHRYRTVNVLEIEASLAAYDTIRHLRGDAAQRALVQSNRSLFHVAESPYADLLSAIAGVVLPGQWQAGKIDADGYDALLKLTPFLLDIALAVPPPSYLQQHGLALEDFLPGVRLVRLLEALAHVGDMGPVDYSDDIAVYSAIDKHCRSTPRFTYPGVRDIYAAWMAEFDRVAATEPYRETALRKRALCERRLQFEYPVWSRAGTVLMGLEIPFKTRVGVEESIHTLFGSMFTDAGPLASIEHDAKVTTEAMMHYVLGMQPRYNCPLAVRNNSGCKAQTAACLAGIQGLNTVPRSADCRVHQHLQKWYWNLEQPLPAASRPSWA